MVVITLMALAGFVVIPSMIHFELLMLVPFAGAGISVPIRTQNATSEPNSPRLGERTMRPAGRELGDGPTGLFS